MKFNLRFEPVGNGERERNMPVVELDISIDEIRELRQREYSLSNLEAPFEPFLRKLFRRAEKSLGD